MIVRVSARPRSARRAGSVCTAASLRARASAAVRRSADRLSATLADPESAGPRATDAPGVAGLDLGDWLAIPAGATAAALSYQARTPTPTRASTISQTTPETMAPAR